MQAMRLQVLSAAPLTPPDQQTETASPLITVGLQVASTPCHMVSPQPGTPASTAPAPLSVDEVIEDVFRREDQRTGKLAAPTSVETLQRVRKLDRSAPGAPRRSPLVNSWEGRRPPMRRVRKTALMGIEEAQRIISRQQRSSSAPHRRAASNPLGGRRGAGTHGRNPPPPSSHEHLSGYPYVRSATPAGGGWLEQEYPYSRSSSWRHGQYGGQSSPPQPYYSPRMSPATTQGGYQPPHTPHDAWLAQSWAAHVEANRRHPPWGSYERSARNGPPGHRRTGFPDGHHPSANLNAPPAQTGTLSNREVQLVAETAAIAAIAFQRNLAPPLEAKQVSAAGGRHQERAPAQGRMTTSKAAATRTEGPPQGKRADRSPPKESSKKSRHDRSPLHQSTKKSRQDRSPPKVSSKKSRQDDIKRLTSQVTALTSMMEQLAKHVAAPVPHTAPTGGGQQPSQPKAGLPSKTAGGSKRPNRGSRRGHSRTLPPPAAAAASSVSTVAAPKSSAPGAEHLADTATQLSKTPQQAATAVEQSPGMRTQPATEIQQSQRAVAAEEHSGAAATKPAEDGRPNQGKSCAARSTPPKTYAQAVSPPVVSKASFSPVPQLTRSATAPPTAALSPLRTRQGTVHGVPKTLRTPPRSQHGPPRPKSMGLSPRQPGHTIPADKPFGRRPLERARTTERPPAHEITRIGFLNSNKRLLANTKSAKEARLKWAQQATDNRLSCLSVCETGHADWKDERTLPFKQGGMRVIQGADARVPPSHDLGGSRGSAAGGVVTLCKPGARTTPYRGTIGDCLWYQCFQPKPHIFIWSLYMAPRMHTETFLHFLASVAPILENQRTIGTVILGGDMNIRMFQANPFQPRYLTQDLGPATPKNRAVVQALFDAGWMPVPHRFDSPIPYTFHSRGCAGASQPDHVFALGADEQVHLSVRVVPSPLLNDGTSASDHHMMILEVSAPRSRKRSGPPPAARETRLPAVDHALWGVFTASEAAKSSANCNELWDAAQAFFRETHSRGTALTREADTALATRKARIKAWKCLRAAASLEGAPPGSAEHKAWVASSKTCKKAWRLLKRKYARHSRQARHNIIFQDAWRSLTRNKKTLAPEPALFLEHQRSVMGSQPGSEAVRADLTPLDLNCFPPFTEAEARAAIDKLQTGKMPGVDKLPAELAKAFPDMFARQTTAKLTAALESGVWPEEWRVARGHALAKVKEPRADEPTDFRMIAALPTEAKIATYMVLSRLRGCITPHIPPQQTGFAPHTRVEIAVTGVSSFIRQNELKGAPTLLTAVDVRKAFDTVDRTILHRKLEEADTPPALLRLLRSYLERTTVKLPSGDIHYTRGVVQGCVLSPLLFALYTASIVNVVPVEPDGEQTQVLFAYADDLLLASTKPTEHADALGRICDAVDQVKLTIHPQKCQTLVCSSEKASAEAAMQEAEAALVARGSPLAPLRTATRLRYLGHTFAAQGLLPGDEDLARSANLLAQTVRGSSKVAMLRPRQIVRLCKTLVLPRLDWGLAVPTDPGESGALWEEQDKQSDEILAKAVILPIFGPMTTKRRKLPDEIILMEVGIKPAWERRRNLARGLITVLESLGRLHPTEASMRTGNGAQAQVLQWLHLRAQDRAAYHSKRSHPFARARQATLAGGGVHAPVYDLLRTPAMRRAVLKFRCNSNTFMPGDAMPFGPTMVHCTNQACQQARDTISHRLLHCTKQDMTTPREECMTLLQAAINVPTAAELACSRTELNPGTRVQLLQALATLDVQTAAKLGITRASISARQQLRHRVCCIVASLIHRLMANARLQIIPSGASDT